MSESLVANEPAMVPVDLLLRRLPPEVASPVREALEAARPFVELVAAEATARELRVADARGAADEAATLTESVRVAIADALKQERARWSAALSAVERPGATADEVAAALELDGPVRSADAFDAFMEDNELSLRLGPETSRREVDSAARLAEIAQPTTPPAGYDAEETASLLRRCAFADVLTNDSAVGAVVLDDGDAVVLLGDGTGVGVDQDGTIVRESAPSGPHPQLAVRRIAAVPPPVLAPAARAALAAVRASRDDDASFDPSSWAGNALVGATLPISETKVGVREVFELLNDARKAGLDGGAVAGPCFKLAYEIFRVRLETQEDVNVERQQVLIDVGRVRWCELSQQALTWLPLFSDHPDTVGGGDRPWTAGLPSQAATWVVDSPALRLDRVWTCPVVFDVDSCRTLVVAPDGSWWDLAVDFEGLVLARSQHLEAWLDAIERFEEDAPAAIERAHELVGQKQQLDRRLRVDPVPEEEAIQPFTQEWIEVLAGRYEYVDDDGAKLAGERSATSGAYSRRDFLTVVRWKSARALPRASRNDDEAVAEATAAAFDAPDEQARMTAVTSLMGVGAPIASALLHFAFPDRFPILDFRALETLGDRTTATQYSPAFWERYVERCQAIAGDAGVSIRDLDKALWQWSKEVGGPAGPLRTR